MTMKTKRRQTRSAATSTGLEDGGGDGNSSPTQAAGSLIFIKLHGNSWWPAQVVDENCVSDARKPAAARLPGEVLIRIYGSQHYAYADAAKCVREFETVVEQSNGNYTDILQRALEQDLPSSKSSGSKGGGSKRKGAAKTTVGASKVVKSEGKLAQKNLDAEYTPGRQSADATAKTKAKRFYGTSREDEQCGPSDVPAITWPVDSEQGSPSRRSRSAAEKAKAKIYDQANIDDELSDEGTATSDDDEGKQKSRGKKKSIGKRAKLSSP